jgi:hypothetical protein
MKNKIILLLISLFSLVSTAQEVEAAGTTGLNYQNYAAGGAMPTYTQDASGNITNRTLLSTGTVNTVGLTTSNGTGLPTRSDGFIVRFYGFINIPTAGTYYFGGQADDGIRIKVNNTLVVDSWIESGGAFRQSDPITLSAGVVPIEVLYYENGGGQMVNFQWYTPSAGVWAIVPTSSLATDITYWAPATPQYSSSITTDQQNRVNAFRARTSSEAGIHIEQIGDNNTITIVQKGRSSIMGIGQDKALIDGDSNNITIRQGVDATGNNEIKLRVVGNTNTLNLNQSNTTQGTAIGGNGHYLYTDIFGSLNTLTTQQSNTGGVGGHYAETTISGNSNNVTKLQTGNGNKIMFTNVVGNNNTVTATQKDTGQHYLDLKLTGNGHSANIVQEGSASHRATIDLTNAGGASSIILNQNSNTTPQVYSIQQSCANAAGCSTTVTQNQ